MLHVFSSGRERLTSQTVFNLARALLKMLARLARAEEKAKRKKKKSQFYSPCTPRSLPRPSNLLSLSRFLFVWRVQCWTLLPAEKMKTKRLSGRVSHTKLDTFFEVQFQNFFCNGLISKTSMVISTLASNYSTFWDCLAQQFTES